MNVARVRLMADLLEERVKTDELNMASFAACVLGHAARWPEFQALGLRMHDVNILKIEGHPTALFFGVLGPLFDVVRGSEWHDLLVRVFTSRSTKPTPKEVADELRAIATCYDDATKALAQPPDAR